MCLSVYLGSHEPLALTEAPEGALGIEVAKWTPPALSKFPFRYAFGRKGEEDDLECSCLLAQHIEWDEHGPTASLDDLYSKAPSCPFDGLRQYVEMAQKTGKPVVLACDDSAGVPMECSDEDYNHALISLEMIVPETFLFADPRATFPWRVFHLTAVAVII